MAPSLSETSESKQGAKVEYVGKLKLEAWYVQKKKNDTQEHVRRFKDRKAIVVAIEVQEVVTLEGAVKSTLNRNLQQYKGQPQKMTTRISRRMALFSIEQMKGPKFCFTTKNI
jgi:nitrate reductase alpha subunit